MFNEKIVPRGVVEITATDVNTGQTRVVKANNVSTGFIHHLISSGSAWHSANMWVDSARYGKSPKGLQAMRGGTKHTSKLDRVYAPLTGRHLEDWYVEEVFRFDATGTTNDINVIYLNLSTASATSLRSTLSVISLDNTFQQNPTDLLSIKYRFILNTTGLEEREAYKVAAFVKNALSLSDQVNSSGPMHGYFDPTSMKNSISSTFAFLERYDSSLDYFDSRGHQHDWIKTDEVGTYCGYIGGTHNGLYPGTLVPTKCFIDENRHSVVPNYPMGPLFNHNMNSISHLEDVDNLAIGLGYPIISAPAGSSYRDDDFALESYKFTITKSGNVGVARYDVTTCGISAYGVSDYNSGKDAHLGHMVGNTLANTRVDIPDHESLRDPEVHPLGRMVKPYNSKYVMCSDYRNGKLAITLTHAQNGYKSYGFDTLTTPALPSVGTKALTPKDIRRNEAGDIFCLTNDGYFVIRNPLGVATVETKTLASIGLASGIRAFDVNGDLIQITTGAEFAYSLDGGTTWTIISTSSTSLYTSHTSLVGGDASNPTKVIISALYRGTLWLDASTNTLTVIESDSSTYSYFTNGWFDSNENVYHLAWITGSYKMWFYTGPWGGADGTSENYVGSSSTSPNSEASLGDTKVVKEKNGKYVIYGRDSLARTDATYLTPEGIMLTFPMIPNTDYSSWHIWLIDNRQDFRREIYDEHDGIEEYHYGKHGVICDRDIGLISYTKYPNGYSHELKEDSAVSSMMSIYSATARWDVNSSEWKHGWNADAPATADGSSQLSAIRIGFATDSQRFNNGGHLDISSALATGTYNTNGMSIAINSLAEAKNVGTMVNGSWLGNTGSQEVPTSCIFELADSTTKQSIALMSTGYDNTLTLVDMTDVGTNALDEVSLGISPSTSAARFVLTLNSAGTIATVYMNGVQQGSPVTLNSALPLTGTLKCLVGARIYGKGRVEYNGSGFKGLLNNIVVYDNVMTAGEITTDAATPLGLTKTTDVVVRYTMDTDYQEGRVTSNTDTLTLEDVSIRFNDGDLSSPSYVVTDDYTTTKAKYGFVKDNATTASLLSFNGLLPTRVEDVTSPITGTNVIPAADGMVTDYVPTTQTGTYQGHCRGNNVVRFGDSYVGVNAPSDDGIDISFEDHSPDNPGAFNICNYASMEADHPDSSDLIRVLFGNNTVTWDVAGYTDEVINHTRAAGDKWRVVYDRSLSEAKLYLEVASVWVQQGSTRDTSGNEIVGRIHSKIGFQSLPFLLGNIKVTQTFPNNVMMIGDRDTNTGSYSNSFYGCSGYATFTDANRFFTVRVDNLLQTIVNKTADVSDHAKGVINPDDEPPVGTVHYYSDCGALVFNKSEAGKTVTVANPPVLDTGIVDDV